MFRFFFGFYFLMMSSQLKGFEVIKAVHLDPVPFDMERDLLTPTYKKKRPQLLKYYQVPKAPVFSV
jgi:long-subunit acyl-CoA synthetase (AMP-forming)